MRVLKNGRGLAVLVCALSIAFVFAGNLVSAQPIHPGGMPHKVKGHSKNRQEMQNKDISKHILANAEIIGLTKDQKKQVRNLALEIKKKNIRLNAEQKILQLEIHALLTDDIFDEKKLENKADEISQLNGELIKQPLIGMIQVMKLLNEKQRHMITSKHSGIFRNPLF